jgi:hypothetical protein
MAQRPYPEALETVWQLTKALWALVDLTHDDDEANTDLPQTVGALISFLTPALEEAYCDLAEASGRCTCGAVQPLPSTEDAHG